MRLSNSWIGRLRKRFARREQFANGNVRDPFFYPGESVSTVRDRPAAGFRDVIEKSLAAWREDPLARRIVCLTTQFSVGRGFRISADDPRADQLLREFWEHPLNHMDARLTEWSDELCRTGNLFILFSSDPSGMSYVRAVPAGQIEEIVPMENDIEQPKAFRLREIYASDPARIPEEKIVEPASLIAPTPGESMLHFTVNRPVGGQWGEPDLAPILVWLRRYNEWLEDRMRLNHYRNCFVFTVKSSHCSEEMRIHRQMQLNLHPPAPGTILVISPDEQWEVIQPNLESDDANEDGFAVKKMIAAGAGIPVSFLAETSGNSRTENSGMEDSACRNFRQRQQILMYITETVLRHVLARAALVRYDLDTACEIRVYGEDIAAPGMVEGGIRRGMK
ncbi:MAG: hypothetical protein IJI07_05110 [Flexilinea sp.]|nr:hypothetical protein [Flexilinea sp.]